MKSLLSYLYGGAIRLRNLAFDRGIFRVHRVDVPVISVGNITAGGTGKTPIVEMLAAHLLLSGRRTAVVTRGYRRATSGYLLVSDGNGTVVSSKAGGDEAVQIARKFERLIVIADEVRSRGCRRAVEKYSADVIILDDAYQHRAMHRDLDIVVIDTSRELSALRLLPAGRLREPLKNLSRADVIILSKCDAHTPIEILRKALALYSQVPVFAAMFAVKEVCCLGCGEPPTTEGLSGEMLGSFCGIGNPAGFGRTLNDLGVHPLVSRDYPDHHWYTRDDLTALRMLGEKEGVAAWITTEKDAMRLMDNDAWRGLGRVYYLRMEVELPWESEEFFALLDSVV